MEESMPNDPLSRVASWLTPASADVTDPVLALIAEEKRLEALWIAAYDKGDKPQEEALAAPMGAILEQIYNTPPVTIAGAIRDARAGALRRR
jgi:hypothetical protein